MSIDSNGVRSLVLREIIRSRNTHPPMKSVDHAWGVIKEEVEEYFDSVRKGPIDLMELSQVAGCCVMSMKDLFGHNFPDIVSDEDFYDLMYGKLVVTSETSDHEVYTNICIEMAGYLSFNSPQTFRNSLFEIFGYCCRHLMNRCT